jgi:DNA polymerase-3 subunit alpha
VFQFEGQGMRDALRKLRPTAIEDIIALGALYRPGPMENIPVYVDCKHDRAVPDMLHPTLEPILKETYGVIIYQEQVMQIAQVLSGYSLGEADLLRRAMGKKKKEEMDAQKARFAEGAAVKGVDPDQASAIFERVAKFAGYGFNKSHAAAYAMVSYQTAWLKANAPVEFFAASMSLDLSNTDRLAVFYQDARRSGVKLRSPDINRSGADFEVEDGEVLYALGALRNVGLAAMEHVVQVRNLGGPFRDLFDFAERIDAKAINKRAIENLARAGAFDSLHPNRAEIFANADTLMAYAASVSAERASAQVSLFGGDTSAARPRLTPREPWMESEQLDEELAAVGFYLSGHPLEGLMETLRRRRVVLMAEAVQLAEDGQEAFRMAGVVRRKQERPSKSGEKFAFVTLSDPTGEYEVLFPPESLRKCRDVLEVGKTIVIRARAKGRDGEVRFFGDDAEPVDVTMAGAVAALRVHLAPASANLDVLRRRLAPGQSERGGEITLVAAVTPGASTWPAKACEVELKLPGRFALDAALRGALKTAPGVLYLEDV